MDIGSKRKTRHSTQAATRASKRAKKSTISFNPRDLYNAIVDRNQDKIFEILGQKQPEVNLQTIYDTVEDNTYPTALHLVFLNLNESHVMEILETFLDQNYNLDEADDEGRTVLHLAVLKRMKKAIDFLLKRNADILVHDFEDNFITHSFVMEEFKKFDKKSYTDNTYDKRAIEEDSISFVEWLISKGFNFDYENHIGMCALDWAIWYNLQHILPTLLNNTSDITFANKINKRTLLHAFLAAKNDHKKSRISYYCPKRKVRSQDFTRRYDIEIVKILLDNGVSVNDVDVSGKTALHIAIDMKVEIDIVKLLLERFTDIRKEYSGKTLLYDVIERAGWRLDSAEYYAEIMEALITNGAKVKRKDHTKIMHEIIKTRSFRAMKLMKDIGVRMNMQMGKGRNLLHELARSMIYHSSSSKSNNEKQEAIFNFLLKEGCDVNKIDKEGNSPLQEACKWSNAVVAKKLIENGADINRRTKFRKNTILHLASDSDKLVEVAELLLDLGADVNSKNSDNHRPLFLSMSNASDRMAKMLLKRGAYVDIQTDTGDTELSHAICENYPASVKELLKYGANLNHQGVSEALNFLDCENELQFNAPWHRFCVTHFVKLKSINLPCSNWEVEHYAEKEDCDKISKMYLKEIKRLKSTSIDSSTSIYNFLHMNVNSRCIHINNEKFLKIINSELFEKHFPHYHILILGSYREAKARKSLLGPAIKSWIELTNIHLPDICIESIFFYLSNADLVVFIEKDGTVSEDF